MSKIRKVKCVICGSKRNLIQHHKVHPVIRTTFDETITLCQRCHIDVHEAFIDSMKHSVEIENVGYFICPVHKPRKWFGFSGGRLKKGLSKISRKEEIAFYWAIYNYGSLASTYSHKDIKRSVIRL